MTRDPHVGQLPRAGRCACCGRLTIFLRLIDRETVGRFAAWPYPFEYLQHCATRENWLCMWCRRSYRMRTLASVVSPLAAGRDVYHAGSFTTLTGRQAHRPKSIVVSEYVQGAQNGVTVNGIVRQDLQRLTWPDASFDVVVTSEIFEHVTDPWAAFDEVHRVLRPGGVHVFTVPDLWSEPTRSREGLPVVKHMDGPKSEGISVVTDFGCDLPELLRAHGFETVVHEFPPGRPVTHVFESHAR
jgi:SAM-dependent methyltransferase